MSGLTVRRAFQSGSSQRANDAMARSTAERVPRVARLMALAIRFDQMIRDGVVADQAELARLGQVTRARVTQIMDLLNLAPQIQEELLQARESSLHSLSERRLRPVSSIICWRGQLKEWNSLQSEA